MKQPTDYASKEARLKEHWESYALPKGEQREDTGGAILICLTMFGILGMAMGAGLMWMVLT
jgi:hypothetical protein